MGTYLLINSVKALIITAFFNEIFRLGVKLGINRSILVNVIFLKLFIVYIRKKFILMRRDVSIMRKGRNDNSRLQTCEVVSFEDNLMLVF